MNQQVPIGSGFGPAATAEEIIQGIDLHGKNAIVTGGYSGIGLETARVLASAGARVIVPARDLRKAEAALQGINHIEIEEMDLADPASIDAFAQRYLDSGRPLHILVNSAGVGAVPLARDARGYETHFAVNHLGHFQLTHRLWPALQQARGARIVSVSAWAHVQSPVMFDDIHFQHREYLPWTAYGQSKTANILFAVAADKRGKADGIRAYSLHPGSIVQTGLSRHHSQEQLQKLGVLDEDGKPILDPERNLKTVEQGAATVVWCAASPQLDGIGGVYCDNNDIAPLLESGNGQNYRAGSLPLGVMDYAVDPETADRLWETSERMVFGGEQP